jgi:UrcA family protein
MQRSARTISLMVGAATAALYFSAFANVTQAAEFGPEPAKVEIAYSDLDLSRVDGAKTLYSRLARAAYNVCRFSSTPNTSAIVLQHKCIDKALGDAVQTVNNANLTAVYLARNGKRAMVASSR